MIKIRITKRLYLVALFSLTLFISAVVYAKQINPPATMPEFTQIDEIAWLNSKPLTSSYLRGKVVLIDVWTYGCWNCYNSFPWLRSVEEKFAEQDFTVIGIHTPEFEREKEREKECIRG